MSQRLGRLAARVARKRDRTGQSPGLFAEVTGTASRDPWAGIPDSARRKVTETLANGTIAETYVDSLDDLKPVPAPPQAPAPPDELPVAEPAPAATSDEPVEEIPRFARYPMPGHEPD